MPDFNNMTAAELSVWYIANVGYDLGADDPEMSLERYRKICSELHELHSEDWQEFDHADERWSFNADELAKLDSEDGLFNFVAYHRLPQPTVESVIAFIVAM